MRNKTGELHNEETTSQPGKIVLINCTLNVPLIFISLVGNSLVLTAILRTRSLRSPTYIFLCSLAVSDLLVCLFVQPLFIASELTRTTSSLLIDTAHLMSFFACGVSLCTIAAMSIDRYLAIHYHMRYPTLVTIPRVVYVLTIIWIIDCLVPFTYFWDIKASYFIMAAGISICIKITSFSYVLIYRNVRQHQLRIQVQQQTSGSRWIRLKKDAINTFVFCIFIFLCYVPKSVSLVVKMISPQKWELAWVFANTVLFFNSSANPLLYCWRIRELRTVVINLLRKILLRQ